MELRKSFPLDWPRFTVVGDFHGRWLGFIILFDLLTSIENYNLLWTEMASYGGVGDGLSGTMEFSITDTSLGLSTAMVDASLMSEFQQISMVRRLSLVYLVSMMVMGLSNCVGYDNLDIMIFLSTNSWLDLFNFWISTTVADTTSFLAVRVLSLPSGGVIVRVMMMWFIHGVFPGMLGVIDLEIIDVDSDIVEIYNLRRIWNPGITSEVFVVKNFNDIYGVKCTIGWTYTRTKLNFWIRAMASIWTNWYRNVKSWKLISGATGLFYVMWSFKQRMSIKHTYHIRVRWFLKKEHIMYYNMIASNAYLKEVSSNSFFRLCHLEHMAHKFAYVINCFCEVWYWLDTVVKTIV